MWQDEKKGLGFFMELEIRMRWSDKGILQTDLIFTDRAKTHSVCHRVCLLSKPLLHTRFQRSTSPNNEALTISWRHIQLQDTLNEILTLPTKRRTNIRLNDELITMNK